MPLEEPGWWYAPGAHPMARLLAPIASAWGHAAMTRFRRAKPYRSRLPVICIGNFTAGGTGKTPLTLYMCKLLAGRGETPVALTRGYGGRTRGPCWVDPERDRAPDVGDEALLLAAHHPTLLSRDRADGARAIEADPRSGTVIVMDDGLQNPGLEKDLSIAVIDGTRGFGNGAVIPAGPLRAPLAFQLSLADVIVVNEPADGDGHLADDLRRSFTGPVLRATTSPRDATQWLAGTSVVAWAGIGAPERFFKLLERQGANVLARRTFRDHHLPSSTEAQDLLALARSHAAMLVTTEKDLVRVRGGAGAVGELAQASRTLGISLAFIAPEAERLDELVAAALHARRAAA